MRTGYLAQDTIAAISTAVGGAVSMIRLSGPRSFETLERLTGRESDRDSEPRKLMRATLRDPASGKALDDALFARFVAPDSYTGEDVVELHLHGGAYLADQLMAVLATLGARQALPGEFSFRSVRNGKMSLSQAQAVSELITAANDGAIQLALEKMSGTQNRLIQDLAARLRQLAMLGEAGIDFADQDIEEVGLKQLQTRIPPIRETLARLEDSYQRGTRLQEGVSAAFVGLPNAGKSSFFNALLGTDRSIVSEIAGTTRDVVHERLTLRGAQASLTLRLEDTAGLRTAEDPIEKIGVDRSRRSARDADLVLFVADPSSPLEPLAKEWANLGKPSGKTLGILTKCDLHEQADLDVAVKNLESLGIARWIRTSAQSGHGLGEAIDAMVDHCQIWLKREPQEVLLTRLDHLASVKSAIQHLDRALSASEIDLFAADLRQALHALGPLIGETLPDDILGKIFSEFCIGK